MFDRQKMQITFPHLIPGNKLGDVEYTFNDVDGGVKRLADFKLVRNSFFGGQVTVLGLIRSLGVWACQHYETRKIIGFYVDDGNRVTEKGKKLIRERFSDCEIIFEPVEDVRQVLTAEQKAKKNELLNELKAHGVAPELITHTSAAELEGLLKAVKSGSANMKIATEDAKVATPYVEDDKPVEVKKPKRTMAI